MPFLGVIFVGFIALLIAHTIDLLRAIESEKRLKKEEQYKEIINSLTGVMGTRITPAFVQNYITIAGVTVMHKPARRGSSYNGSILDSKSNDEGSIPSEPATLYDCVDCGAYSEQKYNFIGDLPTDKQFTLCNSCHDKYDLYLVQGDRIKSGLVRIKI